jgi:hypothetical protein
MWLGTSPDQVLEAGGSPGASAFAIKFRPFRAKLEGDAVHFARTGTERPAGGWNRTDGDAAARGFKPGR